MTCVFPTESTQVNDALICPSETPVRPPNPTSITGGFPCVNTREGVPARKVTLVLATSASNFCAGVQSAPGWTNTLFHTRSAAMPPEKQRLS